MYNLKRCKAYLLGTPCHTNIGDSAIVIGELKFLEFCGFNSDDICEISTMEYTKHRQEIIKNLPENALIFFTGGAIWEIRGYQKSLCVE